MTIDDRQQAEKPKWDVALAALAREECAKLGRPLRMADFHQLAAEYAIRFDDIMDTLFKLVIHGEWRYHDSRGLPHVITQATLDGLYVDRRLKVEDLQVFDGEWTPDPDQD